MQMHQLVAAKTWDAAGYERCNSRDCGEPLRKRLPAAAPANNSKQQAASLQHESAEPEVAASRAFPGR
jgi:hypothetical protein